MSLVILTSGGLDSTLMAVLAKEEKVTQFPLFIDYGQLCKDQELNACLLMFSKLDLPKPAVMNLSGFGKLIPSGLTSRSMRVNEDAFLPGRNLLFLLVGSAYAYKTNSNAVAIGFLSEETHIFPDQTIEFVRDTEKLIRLAMGFEIKIVTPLINFTKGDVLRLAREKGIDQTYSCHLGTNPPCGICVSCQERIKASLFKEE